MTAANGASASPYDSLIGLEQLSRQARASAAAKCADLRHAVRRHRPGTNPLSFAVPYKAYMGHSVGDLFFTTLEQLDTTLAAYRGCDVSFHCEDPILLESNKGAATHEQRRPAECEISATRFALTMIEKYDLTGKLCHYSVGEGLPLIREARRRGLRVTCEVTPHHLYFDTADITEENRKNDADESALRAPRADRLAMLARAARRHARVIWRPTMLRIRWQKKPAGISGQPHLDTYGAFVTWLIVTQGISSGTGAAFCSDNPGRFVNRYTAPRKVRADRAGLRGLAHRIKPGPPDHDSA